MNTPIDLQIGDKIYISGNYGINGFAIVQRLTPTQIILSNGSKLRRPFYDGSSKIGGDIWSIQCHYVETLELNERYERQKLTSKIENLIKSGLLGKLPLSQLKAIDLMLADIGS